MSKIDLRSIQECRISSPRALLEEYSHYLSNSTEDYLVYIEAALAAQALAEPIAKGLFLKAIEIHPNDYAYICAIRHALPIKQLADAENLYI